MTRPTPETDELREKLRSVTFPYPRMEDHARRLERQRDEAARLLRRLESLAALAAPDNHPGRQEARAFLAQLDKEKP